MATVALQKDLLTKRWRCAITYARSAGLIGVRLPKLSETTLQINLVAELRLRLRPDVEFWHTPNGGLRNKREAARLKAMGVKPGVPDLTFEWFEDVPCTLHIELKAKGGKLSPAQILFGKRANERGHTWVCLDNVADAIDLIDNYGLLK